MTLLDKYLFNPWNSSPRFNQPSPLKQTFFKSSLITMKESLPQAPLSNYNTFLHSIFQCAWSPTKYRLPELKNSITCQKPQQFFSGFSIKKTPTIRPLAYRHASTSVTKNQIPWTRQSIPFCLRNSLPVQCFFDQLAVSSHEIYSSRIYWGWGPGPCY